MRWWWCHIAVDIDLRKPFMPACLVESKLGWLCDRLGALQLIAFELHQFVSNKGILTEFFFQPNSPEPIPNNSSTYKNGQQKNV